MIRAVVFDLDDTLTPEFEYVKSGYAVVSRILSSVLGMGEQELYEMLIALYSEDRQRVFNRLFEQLDKPYSHDDIMMLVHSYRNHVPTIMFYDDVIPCLERARQRKLRIGIITDGYAVSQKQKLRALNAHQYFDHIIVTDDLGREYWKPHPLPFELMKETLGVEFHEMMYVGDNPSKDFYISQVYPITTVRIDRKGIYKETPYRYGVKEHYTIESFSQLIFD